MRVVRGVGQRLGQHAVDVGLISRLVALTIAMRHGVRLGCRLIADSHDQTVEVADGLEHELLVTDRLQGGGKGSRLRPYYR